MDIIKSSVIHSEYDVFWEDISPVLKDASPRPVLVLVNSYEKGGAEETQLLKMIEACQLMPEQYNIIQLGENEKASWPRLREKLNPRIIFLIGIYPIQLGISSRFLIHEPNHFNDCIWLPALSVNKLRQHEDARRKLWLEGINPVFISKQYGGI